MLMLPYINVTTAHVSWLVGICGVMLDTHVGPHAVRASMVLRMVVSSILGERPPTETEMRHTGTWVHTSGNAAMVHYFSSKGVAAQLGTLMRVRDPLWRCCDRAWCSMQCLYMNTLELYMCGLEASPCPFCLDYILLLARPW